MWEQVGSGAAKATVTGGGSRNASADGWEVGHLDTFHLPGYAVGPFLVTNSDEYTFGGHASTRMSVTALSSSTGPSIKHHLIPTI